MWVSNFISFSNALQAIFVRVIQNCFDSRSKMLRYEWIIFGNYLTCGPRTERKLAGVKHWNKVVEEINDFTDGIQKVSVAFFRTAAHLALLCSLLQMYCTVDFVDVE